MVLKDKKLGKHNMKTLRLSLVASALALSLGLSGTAAANTTSSGIKGHITGPQKLPAAGTVITITHVPSGSTKTTTVNNAGIFTAKGLRVGGPYTIKVDSDTYSDQTINNIFLSLGETYPLDLSLASQQSVERIEVTGQALTADYGSTSPSTNFNLDDLETAPSVTRDIKDLVRVDPRVYVDESRGNSVQCAGGSPRYNSLTVDGVRMNDNFGLNGNGYPTERIPFSFDAIDQVVVELAPFDVQYGGFTACNVNAVTKSGDNEFHGSAFYDYTDNDMKADSLEGEPIELGKYSEKRYGFNFGMPIISDSLFLFVAYEELEGSQNFQYDPLSSGKVSQATIDQIAQISRDKYNYEPGSLVPSMPVDDQKLLMKLDWNINDDHRASFVYNYNDGITLAQSDLGSSRISLSNHFYTRGSELKSVVASVYSDWTENFSTEIRIGKSELDNSQQSIDQASGFGEFSINTNNITVYLGPDDSRQSNKLSYETLSMKFAGTYYFDEHQLTFGYEREDLDVFNLFVQHSQGEYRFNSIEDFENGIARVYYGNASSHNPNDAAGLFGYVANTAYVQDEYDFIDQDVTVIFGLRYEWYTSDDVPQFNQNFMTRYGFSNQQNMDGKDLIQPRLGFNWSATDNLEIRGGVGLYSGGNPNVWISNSYSNDGVSNIQENTKNMQILGPDAVAFNGDGQPGYDIPQSLYDEVGSYASPDKDGDSDTNVTDPNFEIPSEWKYSLGATYTTDDDYVVTADLLISDKQDSAVIKNIANGQVSTAPDGRPIYDGVNHGGNADFLLTNVKGEDGESTIVSFSVSKTYDNGFKFSASYAFTEALDVHPMTSSVAFSNYHGIALSDPENPKLARSNYEIPHRFTLNLGYVHEFLDGYETKINLFGQANEGRPYDYNFHNRSSGFGFNNNHRQLMYVPLMDDPNVMYEEGVKDQLDAFIAAEGMEKYRGQILPRNALDSDWWIKFDFRVEQEIMGFMEDHKASAYLIIENLGNFINDDWGVLKQGSFLQSAVKAEITDDNKYLYTEFTDPSVQSRSDSASQWEVRLGVKYKF
jgi:hypothetical protein